MNIKDEEILNNFDILYPEIQIFEEQIKDKVRTLSFKAAIDNNSNIFKDKVKYIIILIRIIK
jgi:hypothetical protein